MSVGLSQSKRNIRQREYRKNNLEKLRQWQKKYYLSHLDKHRSYNKIWARERIKRYRIAIFEKLGNQCVKCGFSDPRALQVDHINGGGGREFRLEDPSAKSRRTLYKKILEDETGKYQILCANCNWIKRYENNEIRRVD